MGYSLDWLYRLPFLPALPSQNIGMIVVLAGFLLWVSAIRTLRKHGTAINPTKPTTRVVSDGPYRFSRNPMYLGLTLLYLGVAFLVTSLWAILLLVLVLGIINWHAIAREERYLEAKFGDEYRNYRHRVRKWL